MADSVGTYSNVANLARVRAGLNGNPGRLQGAPKSPGFTFVDGNPKGGQMAAGYDMETPKVPILDTWVNRRLGKK